LPTITDGSGTVRTSSAIGNRYTYTGREWDGVLGLYHYRARMFEATVGRFCSRDPIGFDSLDSCLYGYSFANPLFWSDFSGLFPQDPKTDSSLDEEQKKEIDKCANGQKCGTRNGGPTEGQNGWIECDGNGKPVVKIREKKDFPESTNREWLAGWFGCGLDTCSTEHEEYHILQISYLDPDVCKGKEKGEIVQLPASCLATLECRAWQYTFDCYQKALAGFKKKNKLVPYTDKDGRRKRVNCKNFVEGIINKTLPLVENQYKCSELRIKLQTDLAK